MNIIACVEKDSRIPCTFLRYSLPDGKIRSVSCSSTDVLYILTNSCEIFSLCCSTLALTKMAISGLQSRGHITRLLYHDGLVYVVQWFGLHIGAAIYKCNIEHNSSLRVVGSYTCTTRHRHMLSHMLRIKGGYLYSSTSTNIDVIDSNTMTLLSTIMLPCTCGITDIATSKDNKMHVATVNGVRVCTTDGTFTGQSYLDGVFCVSITCTSDGYSIVGMKEKVAVVSSDLISVHYISATSMGTWHCHVMCDAVDNSLVITDMLNSRESLVIVPQEVYRPPFSLFSLCMSTILLNANELPISLLPSRFCEQIERYI